MKRKGAIEPIGVEVRGRVEGFDGNQAAAVIEKGESADGSEGRHAEA